MNDNLYKIYGTNSVALTYEEEVALLRTWGDRNEAEPSAECIECRDTLIKNYLLFSVKKVRSMYKFHPQDAVMEIAHDALLKSINGFDCDRAVVGRLNGLIPWYARVANKEFLRRQQTVKCPVQAGFEGPRFMSIDSSEFQINEQVAGGQNNAADALGYEIELRRTTSNLDTVLGIESSPVDDRLAREKKQAVAECLKKMSKSHRQILELVYFKGLNFAEVARKLKPAVTREAVRQKHNKAIQRLRDALKEKGIFTSE